MADPLSGEATDDVDINNLNSAAARVDFRLTYAPTSTPRECHGAGISGPMLINAYYRRGLVLPGDDSLASSGDWEDFEHPDVDAPEEAHIDRWFQTAVREAIHEALEWFWVDGKIFLDPHGENEDPIHELSETFARQLLGLRHPESTKTS